MSQAFVALAGTDNVRPFAQMVAQNHGGLGNKNFQTITVYSNGVGVHGTPLGPDIMVKIG